jgi:undecaprenyl-diphosphatase
VVGLPLMGLDMAIVEAAADLRVGPLTAVMEVATSWWIKGPLLLAIALAVDLAARRRLPACFLAGALGFTAAVAASMLLKEVFERTRPAIGDPGFEAAIATPASASMPSGHACEAFAVATAIVLWHRRAGAVALIVATVVAASRVYLGVHFLSDVAVGAALGVVLGWMAVLAVGRLGPESRAPARARVPWRRLRGARAGTSRGATP